MAEHTHVINRKTGVVHGRTKQLDNHPDCMPYFPPAEQAAAPASGAKPAGKGKGKRSEAVSAAASIAAAEAAAAPIEEVDFTRAVQDAGAEE